jgi:hypothetical protein
MAIGEGNEPVRVDMLDNLTRTALEFVAQGGIGTTFKQFEKEDVENHFTDFVTALRTVL